MFFRTGCTGNLDGWQENPGHLLFTAATQAGADVLGRMPYIHFGVQGCLSAHLLPQTHVEATSYAKVDTWHPAQHVCACLGGCCEQRMPRALLKAVSRL